MLRFIVVKYLSRTFFKRLKSYKVEIGEKDLKKICNVQRGRIGDLEWKFFRPNEPFFLLFKRIR